ncbi:MAG: PAS domain S-box protein [bacterium]|nr:PAS domain S-box protein [bacterium]
MGDESKTKQQLIDQLAALRQENLLLKKNSPPLNNSKSDTGSDSSIGGNADEEMFRTLAEALPTAILITHGVQWIYVNPSVEQVTGYSSEEMLSQEFHEVVHPDFKAMLIKRARERLAGNTPSSHYEIIIITKDGTERWVYINAVALQFRGAPAILISVIDISEQKAAQLELQHLRNMLGNIIDSMPSILVGVDPDGRVTHWNKQAEIKTGINQAEARGRNLESVFPQLLIKMDNVRRAIVERRPLLETKVPGERNGEICFEDVTVYPLIANGLSGAVIRVDDVTERVRIEEMMIQSEKMLSVGGLAAGMAHEINNPLAGILQNIQLMSNRTSATHPKNERMALKCGTSMAAVNEYFERRGLKDMLDAISQSTRRAAKIVENMLSFSKKGRSQTTLNDLAQLLDNTIELASHDYNLKKMYDFRKIEIRRQYPEQPVEVSCESSKIQQVFLNILKNGAEAMSEAGEANPCFMLRVVPEKEMVRVEIEDNGPGMPPDTCRRVFEPFFTTKSHDVGTGLGLSVSYFIVTENHNGTLEVESIPGKGTSFIIRLPFKPAQ